MNKNYMPVTPGWKPTPGPRPKVKYLRDEGGPVKVQVLESLAEMRVRLLGLRVGRFGDKRAPERMLSDRDVETGEIAE